MSVLDRMPWAAKDSVFRRLAQIAEVRNLTKEERLQYDQSLKHYRDTLNVMRGAVEEGETKGMQRGMQKGLQQGLQKGIVETAQKMKHGGLSIDQIIQFTGLTREEVEKL